MNKKQNPLQIRVGDTVKIRFTHYTPTRIFLAEVLHVTDRTLMGCDACIDYKPEESARDLDAEKSNIPYGCSVSHVIEVVKRAPYKAMKSAPTNIFRENIVRQTIGRKGDPRNTGDWQGYYRFGDIRVGYEELGTLVEIALASAKDTLDRPMDIQRFRNLWAKDGYRGKVALPVDPLFEDPYTKKYIPAKAVRWSVFRNYVLANRQKILLSRKEMEKAGREYSEAMQARDDDFDTSFSRDLDDEAEECRHDEDALAFTD
jgi:hypothetical protein